MLRELLTGYIQAHTCKINALTLEVLGLETESKQVSSRTLGSPEHERTAVDLDLFFLLFGNIGLLAKVVKFLVPAQLLN